jgi:hypothetical protein
MNPFPSPRGKAHSLLDDSLREAHTASVDVWAKSGAG